jgi:creatinine amidohydrolase/Fe(II)-dependent formamide hydrolase-like protein
MHWEELTANQFPEAVATAEGICLLPLSCLERHSHHLPLGTDMYIGHELCRRAAALEPAIIFPDLIFTQILEAQHCPGTIALDPDLLLGLGRSGRYRLGHPEPCRFDEGTVRHRGRRVTCDLTPHADDQ